MHHCYCDLSPQGEEHNNAGEYGEAKSCGSYALCCNITAIVFYVLAFLGAVVFVVIYVTVGIGSVASSVSHTVDHIHDSANCYSHCDWDYSDYCRFCDYN